MYFYDALLIRQNIRDILMKQNSLMSITVCGHRKSETFVVWIGIRRDSTRAIARKTRDHDEV